MVVADVPEEGGAEPFPGQASPVHIEDFFKTAVRNGHIRAKLGDSGVLFSYGADLLVHTDRRGMPEIFQPLHVRSPEGEPCPARVTARRLDLLTQSAAEGLQCSPGVGRELGIYRAAGRNRRKIGQCAPFLLGEPEHVQGVHAEEFDSFRLQRLARLLQSLVRRGIRSVEENGSFKTAVIKTLAEHADKTQGGAFFFKEDQRAPKVLGLWEHIDFDLRDDSQGSFAADEKIQHIHVTADEVTGCVLADFRHVNSRKGAGDGSPAACRD